MLNLRFCGLLLVCWLNISCATVSIQQYAGNDDRGQNQIYVIDHGYHTALVLPSKPLVEHLNLQHSVIAKFEFVEIGRGDAAFYQTDDVGIGTSLKALFFATPAVLHLSAYNRLPAKRFPKARVRSLEYSDQQLSTLYKIIRDEFVLSGLTAHALAEGRDSNSRFYQAQGSYHLFYTCNNWTADMLQQSGYPISSGFAFFADSVMRQIDRVDKVIAGECQFNQLNCGENDKAK